MSVSETNSECTTGRESSLGNSRECLQELAISLGLHSADFLTQERFKVDRRRLESLIFGNAPDSASQYFDSIMNETRTHIAWPSRLKLAAKSKKDPYIRIVGKAEDVRTARERIVAALDTKRNRVNLKIDVSYTDHSHIIGKGGLTIKKVTEETGCHIHFPDSNRNNSTEKSNQVSISGEVWGVEKARAKVRELIPLIFCFELPILGDLTLPDSCSAYIKYLQEMYNVQVMFRTRRKLNSTLVEVKGCELELAKVKEATKLLINHMCNTLTDQVLVQMRVEISPQHHSVILGKNNENLKAIMQNTSTQIVFVDLSDPNILPLKKSNVTITGSIHNVYKARQQLIGSLPVLLMFDVPENTIIINSAQVSNLESNLDVYITARHKPKQNVFSFIIKGIERNVGNIYEARRKLVCSTDPPLQVEIPSTYFIPNAGPMYKTIWNVPLAYPEISPNVMLSSVIPSPPTRENIWPSLPHLLMTTNHVPLQPVLAQHSHPYHYHQQRNHQYGEHFSHSSVSLPELPIHSTSKTSSVSSACSRPQTISPVPCPVDQSCPENHSLISNHVDWKALGIERSLLVPDEYQAKKIHAKQAMQKALNPKEMRVPNPGWAGYGLSQSSPTAALQEANEKRKVQDWLGMDSAENESMSSQDIDLTNVNNNKFTLPVSNYLDSVPQSTLLTVNSLNTQSINSILDTVGLEKYAKLFEKHEIDIFVFRTLTEADLIALGVSSFGARRTIMACIAELNKRKNPVLVSAAPGAERKKSSSGNLNENW